ncbi:MAG TPA: ribonuclease H-like domain-containing protein [Candidatus Nanoarchaeia archaeon]|nr:ribonuclease H-like domain-containing protein [Candidatus Nanoarchaeia archaeon]
MIEQSFIFLKDVSYKTENLIWSQAKDWNSFLSAPALSGISSRKKFFHDAQLRQAQKILLSENIHALAKLFPKREHWRLYDWFKDEAVFLDIETSMSYGNITVIGLYDGKETKQLVKGFNLDKDLLKRELSQYKLLITFNGASFDLPVIQRYFKDILPNIPHIDLRSVCTRIGWTGGLKKIEQDIGIKRPGELDGMAGGDAIILWDKFIHTEDRSYLDKLLLYNEQDILNLKPLANQSISRLWKKTRNDSN